MPTITYWPGTIKTGKSAALLSQVDLPASLAALVGRPVGMQLNSENHINAWLGQAAKGQTGMLEEAFTMAVR